jgi:hypothetical protein
MQLYLPLKWNMLKHLLTTVHQSMHRVWLRHHRLLAIASCTVALSTVIPIPLEFIQAWGSCLIKSLAGTVMSRQLILTLLIIGCVEVGDVA